MAATRKRSRRTVYRGSAKKLNKGFYLLVFALTAVAVYRWGAIRTARSKPTDSYTSTATVYHQTSLLPEATAGETALSTSPDPHKLSRQIAPETNLRKTVREVNARIEQFAGEDPQRTLQRELKRAKRYLRVSAAETARGDRLRISLSYTHSNPMYASQLVNGLATRYAEERRTAWKTTTQRAYAAAREASDRARQEFLRAKARLDAFVEQHLKERESPATEEQPEQRSASEVSQRGGPSPAEDPAAARVSPSVPRMVDNPEWVALNQRVVELKQHLDELLAYRTPLHPQVRYTETRMAALKELLATTARRIPAKQSDAELESTPEKGASASPDTAVDSGATASASAAGGTGSSSASVEAAAGGTGSLSASVEAGGTGGTPARAANTFLQLRQAVERTDRACDRAAEIEREAWQKHTRPPRIEIDFALPAAARASRDFRLQLVLVALAAAAAVVVGMGMISTGAAMEPTLDSAAEVESVVSVPVVGVVSAAGAEGALPAASGWQPLLRLTMIVGGVGLIAGCAKILLAAL